MVDILKDVQKWLDEGREQIVIGILLDLEGSAVRSRGAVMAVTSDGIMAGSVSGGCIESSVMETAKIVFQTGKSEVITFCQIDDPVFGSVSPCGGDVTIAVTPLCKDFFISFCELSREDKVGSWGFIYSEKGDYSGSLFAIDKSMNVLEGSFSGIDTLTETEKNDITEKVLSSETTMLNTEGKYNIFSMVLKPIPLMVIIGATHIGIALCSIAKMMGYRVTVVDPRTDFARDERFPDTDSLLKIWPRKAFKEIGFTPRTAVVVLTHDSKIDDQAISLALGTDSFYIGALGSRSVHLERIKRLSETGIAREACELIHCPIGLSINSANPEEIALSIMAEVVKEYRDRYGKY